MPQNVCMCPSGVPLGIDRWGSIAWWLMNAMLIDAASGMATGAHFLCGCAERLQAPANVDAEVCYDGDELRREFHGKMHTSAALFLAVSRLAFFLFPTGVVFFLLARSHPVTKCVKAL